MENKTNIVGHGGTVPFEYNQITDQIYIGTNMCCQIDFDKELLAKGISADLSLEKESLDSPFGVDFFVWIPIADYSAPTMDQLDFAVSTIDKLVSMNKKIYVHCKNGHGRAPTIVAAYFISKGYTVENALQKIRDKRPAIHLSDPQINALKDYAISLDKK